MMKSIRVQVAKSYSIVVEEVVKSKLKNKLKYWRKRYPDKRVFVDD